MKTKTVTDLVNLYDALRAMEKAKAALYAGEEAGLASRVGGLAREVEHVIELFEVVECRASLHQSMQKL